MKILFLKDNFQVYLTTRLTFYLFIRISQNPFTNFVAQNLGCNT